MSVSTFSLPWHNTVYKELKRCALSIAQQIAPKFNSYHWFLLVAAAGSQFHATILQEVGFDACQSEKQHCLLLSLCSVGQQELNADNVLYLHTRFPSCLEKGQCHSAGALNSLMPILNGYSVTFVFSFREKPKANLAFFSIVSFVPCTVCWGLIGLRRFPLIEAFPSPEPLTPPFVLYESPT